MNNAICQFRPATKGGERRHNRPQNRECKPSGFHCDRRWSAGFPCSGSTRWRGTRIDSARTSRHEAHKVVSALRTATPIMKLPPLFMRSFYVRRRGLIIPSLLVRIHPDPSSTPYPSFPSNHSRRVRGVKIGLG